MHAHELSLLRQTLGLTPSEFVKALGVSMSVMQGWERTDQTMPSSISQIVNRLLTENIHRKNHA